MAADLLEASRRWAAETGHTDIRFTGMADARCAGQFAAAGVECEYIEHPEWGCQGAGFIYHVASSGWTIISTGDIDCSTVSGIVATACAAFGRKV